MASTEQRPFKLLWVRLWGIVYLMYDFKVLKTVNNGFRKREATPCEAAHLAEWSS
jgi:hypothetical protein